MKTSVSGKYQMGEEGEESGCWMKDTVSCL